jgi:hypothetical protein
LGGAKKNLHEVTIDTFIKKPRGAIIASLFVAFLVLMIASLVRPLLLRLNGLTKLNGSVFYINRLLIWVVLLLLWHYATRFEKTKIVNLD